jgi:hypothetical protein
VLAVFQSTTRNQDRKVAIGMRTGVAHPTAEQHQCLVE